MNIYEQHIECGNFDEFKKKLIALGVLDYENSENGKFGLRYLGMKIILNENLSENEAILVDEKGKVIEKYNLSI